MRLMLLSAAFLMPVSAFAGELADYCIGEGEPEAVCDCAETAVFDQTTGTQRSLYIETAILSGLIREEGATPTAAWNDAVVEVAGSFGYGIGDVFEIVNSVEAQYRASLASCR